MSETEEWIAQLERALAEALEERARLWDELNRRTAVERELEHARGELARVYRSGSWRVTKPLRFLGAVKAESRRALGLGRQYARKRRAERG